MPVSRGGNSALPSQTPVIRIVVDEPGITSVVGVAWGLLAVLALALLAGSLVVVDRLGRSFVMPIRQLAEHTQTLGRPGAVTPVAAIEGPPEVQELAGAVERLTGRIQLLLARERESVADLSHRLRTPVTALRLRVETVDDPALRDRLAGDLDALQATVDEIVREARRSEREGLDPRTDAVAVVDRARPPLGGAGRGPGPRLRPAPRRVAGRCCGPAAPTWRRWSTCCSTTSSPTPPTTPP